MIRNIDGRNQSHRTKEELIELIRGSMSDMSNDEIEAFMSILNDVEGDDMAMYDLISTVDYKHPMVGVEEWLEDPYYFGSTAETLYPSLQDDLIELFAGDYHEAILSGSIGWGKTFFSAIVMCRVLYELSCYRDPQKLFGLAKGSTIALVGMSVNEKLAKKVIFESIGNMVKDSPYFQEYFKPHQTMEELRFPNNVWVAPSSTSNNSILGLNVMSAVMDETNFMGAPMGKEQKASHTRWGHIDNAEILYSSIMRRMKSRYMRQGKLPGILMLVSSKKTATDFTERRIREAGDDPNVFVREYSMYTVKPRKYFMPEEFKVLVGNEMVASKIMDEEVDDIKKQEDNPNVTVITVPEDFRRDFERDVDGAIRDIAGIATIAIYPFIRNREKIESCVDENREHPVSVIELEIGQNAAYDWDKIVKKTRSGNSLPVHWPNLTRHIHIDTSIRGDATGLAMGCVTGYKNVIRTGLDGTKYGENSPNLFIDLMLRIVPPLGGEIVFGDIRKFIYELSAKGFHIGLVTLDSYQSFDFKQTLNRQGYRSEIISVDTKLEPYEMLRDAIYDERISYYRYKPFLEEVRKVEMNQQRRKVDHPAEGSKDVSDAVAGICYSLSNMYTGEPINPLGLYREEKAESEYSWLNLSGSNVDGSEIQNPFYEDEDDDDRWVMY